MLTALEDVLDHGKCISITTVIDHIPKNLVFLVDLFGERTPGWSGVTIPWDISLQAVYSYNRPNPDQTVQSLYVSFRGSLSITQSLDVNVVGSIDMLRGELNSPIIDITKRLHCWYLSLNWVPIGVNQGFFLRFGASAQQLRDLVIPKQSTPLYR
jgi:hypothetical protein